MTLCQAAYTWHRGCNSVLVTHHAFWTWDWTAVRGCLEITWGVKFTAAITREGSWFLARCLEVEVDSQGPSVERRSRSTFRRH